MVKSSVILLKLTGEFYSPLSAKNQVKNNKELLANLPSNLKLKEIQIKGLKEEIALEILN